MFGSTKKHIDTDKLTVQLHVVASATAFQLVQKVWGENARSLRTDPESGKEFLHFVYTNPKCVVWLQRDVGRKDSFELVVRWEDDVHEVYVIQNATDVPVGNDQRAKDLLQ